MIKDFNLPLVNAHCHAAMFPFRGMAEDLPLQEWLENHIWPIEKKEVNPEMVYNETKKAIQEMKKNKIAFFVDMYSFSDQVAEAAIEENMPVMIGPVLVDSPHSYENFEQGIEIAENLLKEYQNHNLVKVSVAPHAIYTVSANNLVKAKDLAREYNAIYQIHCAETKKELDDCLKNHNKTPVQYLDDLGILDEKTLLAHCVWLNNQDIEILSKKQVSVAHCPLSNLKLGSGIAPISKMIEKNVLICLGTDGPASSNRLDIWEAGKFATLIQKGVNHNPSLLSVREVIKMMTVNGMKALGINELNGKTIAEWEIEIENQDFSYLYHLNSCQL
ncbi:amidohydrolase [Patescibacteria group bacterium]|nr:amidohydrolase [Patescibacteria group bacterium]MBU4023255.1 amidohydrolase [Patescibacteria group bacterium]MBU4078067.1 amidohydrolase [Patescibacteria group bacterium]